MEDIYKILLEALQDGRSAQDLLDALKVLNEMRYDETCKQGFLMINGMKLNIKDGKVVYF